MGKLFYVLVENGAPVGVAAQDRESEAREWERADPKRRLVIVEEFR